jgi:hypothetical protein
MADEVSIGHLVKQILVIRGHKVMLDSDLAKLYDVETGQFNRSVRRNLNRFPSDFMFQLTEKEAENLKCHLGISSSSVRKHGGRRSLPLAFTEQGVAMLSSVLRGENAALVNIEIMRAFVKLREFLLSNHELARKLNALESKYDARFREVFDAIRGLMVTGEPTRRKIGLSRPKIRIAETVHWLSGAKEGGDAAIMRRAFRCGTDEL